MIAFTVALTTTVCMGAMAHGPFAFGLVVDHLGYAATWAMLILPVVVTAVPLFCPKVPHSA
ncbi:hypothetical protein [Roseomonas populi]|uniref:MFS transporter n=1 Tax=Roseomonas populi TaxID=3121582 RepID=A0ABT1XCI8_9PROT|nr:hypothetical protein [Roseomonas pecuniae]MCR0985441.1 hypothetical protein [Roseomonas pecuniae]